MTWQSTINLEDARKTYVINNVGLCNYKLSFISSLSISKLVKVQSNDYVAVDWLYKVITAMVIRPLDDRTYCAPYAFTDLELLRKPWYNYYLLLFDHVCRMKHCRRSYCEERCMVVVAEEVLVNHGRTTSRTGQASHCRHYCTSRMSEVDGQWSHTAVASVGVPQPRRGY